MFGVGQKFVFIGDYVEEYGTRALDSLFPREYVRYLLGKRLSIDKGRKQAEVLEILSSLVRYLIFLGSGFGL